MADSARAALALCSGAFLTPIAPAASLSCRNSQSCLLLESIKNWLARALLYFVRKSSQDSGVNVRNISRDAGFPHAKIRSPIHSLVAERDADKSVLLFRKKIRSDGTHIYMRLVRLAWLRFALSVFTSRLCDDAN